MHKNPQMTLNRLIKYSTTDNPKFKRLYNCLYSVEFFKLAYSNIYSKPGNMTKASDGSTIDGMSEERINKLIQSLKNRTYRPTNLKRISIPKNDGRERKISIPSFNDKLVQEIIRMILEAIYENTFSDYSHGFRPGRSCHTALESVRQQFRGSVWFIDGDIKGCFDNINHECLLNILREKIFDLRFIHLINLFLKAGYIENWQYHKTYSGIPQGSIIGPILSNIYLDKFDKYMESKILEINKGKKRKQKTEYHRISSNIHATKKRMEIGSNIDENKIRLKKYQEDLRNWKGSTIIPIQEDFRRIHYIRYADDFIIGYVGSRQEIIQIKNKITEWFKNNLKLELSKSKTLITHNKNLVRFLEYDIISVRQSNSKMEKGNIRLSLPYDVVIKFIIKNRMGKWWNNPKSKKDELKGIHRPELINLENIEIFKQYDYSLRGLYQYYKLAENVCKLSNIRWIVIQSYLRTLACKYRSSIAKLYKNKQFVNNKEVGCKLNEKFYELFHGPFKKQLCSRTGNMCNDELPILNKYFVRTSLIQRMEAHKCESCGNEEGPFEIHHVRKLKDLKGKANWEKLMISRQRKTLILCKTCHDKLHAGKL